MRVTLVKGSCSVSFEPKEVEQLKKCSEFVSANLEFGDHDQEAARFVLESDEFGEEELRSAAEYLRVHGYKPPVYKKVDYTSLEQQLTTEGEKSLAARYRGLAEVKRLFYAAKYLQIRSLQLFSLVLLGVGYKVDENKHDSLAQVKQRFGIAEEYDMAVEKEIKAKLPNYGEKSFN